VASGTAAGDIVTGGKAAGGIVGGGTAAGGIVAGGIVAGGIVTGGIVAAGTAADGTAAGGIVAGGTVNVVPDQPEAGLADLLPGRYVLLRISDTGTGMDTVTAGRAFEPFFTTKSGDQAAGLGLSAVRRLIVLSGGKAWLRSQPGTGTTVTMVLPAAAGSSAELTGSGSARPATGNGQAGTVLVVDDEAAIRDVAHRILTQAGYGAVTAAGPPEALVVLANLDAPIDLILTDVVMPGMTAAAFTARARLIRPGIRVLFMSGYEQPGPIPDGWPGPGAQVLDKPFSRATLLAMVSQLLTAQPAARS